MSRICNVCMHPQRFEIDKRLAFQIVNVSALAREYEVGRKSIENHRNRHLESFLAAFQASADAPDNRHLNAELRRLYATALDAITRIQAGVPVQVAEHNGEPVYDRKWNPTALARMLAEARKLIELISKLRTLCEEPAEPAPARNAEIDASILRALDRFDQRQLEAQSPRSGIIDADIVAPERSD